MEKRPGSPSRMPLFVWLALLVFCAPAQSAERSIWPQRVLVTNDNGIEDAGMVELARALVARGVEVVVVAAREDRSGTTNYMSSVRDGEFRVERRQLGPGIRAWALDGYPADCVLFGLSGPMREALPDLVVSGINGGPNLADAWLGSGTIGAARTAAYMTIPAVAVSGVEDDDAEAVRHAAEWTARFVASPLVRALEAPDYLTVSLPAGPPRLGAEVLLVERAHGMMTVETSLVESGEDGREVWSLELRPDPSRAGADTDVAAFSAGHVAIVPMRAGDANPELASKLRALAADLPSWPDPPES